MSFASNTGYVPQTVAQLMDVVRVNVNTQFGTTYTEDTFLGTNFYKYFYALIQRLQENEVKTSEIFLRMQEYFAITNEQIRRPNTTPAGILDIFEDAGYSVSVKEPLEADAGKVYICVDVDSGADDYAETKLAICNIIKDCVVAGVVSMGTESESITLSNNQSFDFKYSLPDKIAIDIKVTIVISDNNSYTIGSDASVRETIFANINDRYHLGMDFEPQRYVSIQDIPWAKTVLLEYDAGSGFVSTVAALDFDEVYTFAIGDITVVYT